MSLLVVFAKYWYTLRHLKPVQLYGRVWFKVWRPKLSLALSLEVADIARPGTNWVGKRRSLCAHDTFCFLNQTHTLDAIGGWNAPTMEKLWLYNLHYFDDLNAIDALDRRASHQSLLMRWVSENSPGEGNGWEPYPTSLRIVNWVKWAISGNSLPQECVHSLALQTRWLMQRLEWHLLGNHLFANAKALVFAGVFYEGKEADEWLAKGLAILKREIPEQILADGGHFERSPMYHAVILEDILDLINVAGLWVSRVPDDVKAHWETVAERMLNWMRAMSHPDGEIAFFNDAAIGIASNVASLRAYAQRLGIQMKDAEANDSRMPDSGYIRLENPAAVALLDVAPVGPDYLPGHAHADTLSFELSLFGQRIIVNGGTSCYGYSAQRQYERGTAAHSTVEIDGQNSSEVWSGFRVARRSYPQELRIRETLEGCVVSCSHDGYRRLPGKPVHRRTWTLQKNALVIEDVVTGDYSGAVARFHLHPDVSVEQNGDRQWLLRLNNNRVAHVTILEGSARVTTSTFAPEFGIVRSTQCIAAGVANGRVTTSILWT